ncbi:MAG: cytidyltransferase, partial [Clostridia bacterium]|nr:cytidyltransferase [Clostridia bacterium]
SDNNFSCTAVLNLCKPLLDELSGDAAPGDWLPYLYQYALSKSFPNAAILELKASLELPSKIFLIILRIVSHFQKLSEDDTWQSKYPVKFLTDEEIQQLETPSEYNAFIEAFNNEYIYEMMKLSQEVYGYNTLDHICGVNAVAAFIGKQLMEAGLPVDMGRVSGAALGHDIGKYGCKTNELKRVPYLHYYYTDQWFRKHNITYIGHIAVNHSTWDLELENLPLESLILIYADFRVKNKLTENGAQMNIYGLQESFDVILKKLDNVDEKKEKRYKRVYAKLKDFEDYMVSLGINTELDLGFSTPKKKSADTAVHYSLMHGQEIIQNIKYLAINHNISLMHKLRDESSMNEILELARGESDWKRLREYLAIFEEYSTYLTQKQKLVTLRFLYEQLVHPEDHIRRQCAGLIGLLIASFDEEYRKEVPEDSEIDVPEITAASLLDKYLDLMINPDHKVLPMHRNWIGYSIIFMTKALFASCKKKQRDGFVSVLSKYYSSSYDKSDEIKLYLLEAVKYIRLDYEHRHLDVILECLLSMLEHNSLAFRLSAKESASCLLDKYSEVKDTSALNPAIKKIKEKIQELLINQDKQPVKPTETFINLKLASKIHCLEPVFSNLRNKHGEDMKNISSTFLSNLKSVTDWVVKRAQTDLILDYALHNPSAHGFYTAMHLCNLLKVSASEVVRNRAGEALIKIIPYLSLEQRNDVAIELLRALELDSYHFAEYIPNFLGKIILFLQPVELDELLEDFESKIKQSSAQLNTLLLRTIGNAIQDYHSYAENFKEEQQANNKRLAKMLGIVLNGLVHYDNHIQQVSFSVLCREIFHSRAIVLDMKYNIFKLIAKKMLTLLADNRNEELTFLTNSAGLNEIYKFICDYIFYNGSIVLDKPDKAAFFPGTFDPFSLSHKEIATNIRNLGFEVYLAVDEFSWSKRTLPNIIRKNIINMSIADELNIYLYPEDYPTNLANSKDLALLKSNLTDVEVYIVAGSDVILNASSYKKDKEPNSIHTFSHIVFERKSTPPSFGIEAPQHEAELLEQALKNIEGEVVRLALPAQYEDISSTQIRNSIDENRDISMLIDPLAQRYIYENGFYKSEPQYKSMIQSIALDMQVVEDIGPELLKETYSIVRKYCIEIEPIFESFLKKAARRILVLRDGGSQGEIIGFAAFHRVYSHAMYQDIKDSKTTDFLRNHATGKILMLDGIFVKHSPDYEVFEQILLTEVLAFSLGKDYEYAVFKSMFTDYDTSTVLEALKLQGFFEIPSEDAAHPFLAVNMGNPCSIILDARAFIKDPIKNTDLVKNAVISSRKKLQEALVQLYPGNLVLPFNRHVLYEAMSRKICKENNVPSNPTSPRALGPAMCVPYGNILNKSIVPNTVTKSLHTEKMFAPDMKRFDVGSFPHYLNLDVQVRMIKSFDRPIILVDDILHKGYRIKKLDPLLKQEQINVQKIVVGILSGK